MYAEKILNTSRKPIQLGRKRGGVGGHSVLIIKKCKLKLLQAIFLVIIV